MKRRLTKIFGPFVLAFLLLGICLFTPLFKGKSPRLLHNASASMSRNVISADAIKGQALQARRYVPFFGSSELSRISPFHPTVLAEKYHRDYHPFLLGSAGTQSLAQYMMMQSMPEALQNRKIIFIISPQWFVKAGVKDSYFSAFYSKQQTEEWLLRMQRVQPEDRYLARRLSAYPLVTENGKVKACLEAVRAGELPTKKDIQALRTDQWITKQEDELFSPIGVYSKQSLIEHCKEQLPKVYQAKKLENLAEELGRKATKNNTFGIQSYFYSTRLAPNLKHFKNSQTSLDYRCSKEFADFQLVLAQLSKTNTDALFIIPPLNERWTNYTGLSQEMIRGFAKKITHQLKSQGFHHVADLTAQGDVPYFMEDTIHLGWKGWLEADQYILDFLESKDTSPLAYHTDDYFFSREWQEKKPGLIRQERAEVRER